MKKIITAILWWGLHTAVFPQTQQFTGQVKFIGPGVTVFANEILITMQPGNTALVRMHYKARSPHETDEEFSDLDINGTINGMLDSNGLVAKGWMDFELVSGKYIDKVKRYTVIKGTLNEKQLDGKIIFYEKEEAVKTDASLSFSASAAGEPQPELTFPLGKSPKIFNKGWTLGARFIIKDKNGKDIDLSDKIKWSGTAVFYPATGKKVQPQFAAAGKNKIVLTVQFENKMYRGEYVTEVVNALDYARVGSMAICPADNHGCAACPHNVRGPVISGNALVLINGKPAACVGDKGTHAACCGPNTFTIAGGDAEVLIAGKPAAKLGSTTQHCGGIGKITAL